MAYSQYGGTITYDKSTGTSKTTPEKGSSGFSGRVVESQNGTQQATTYYSGGTPIAVIKPSAGGGSTGTYTGAANTTYNLQLANGENVSINPNSVTTTKAATPTDTPLGSVPSGQRWTITDQPGMTLGNQPVKGLGFPIGTEQEASLAAQYGASIYGVPTAKNSTDLVSTVDNMALASQVVVGYSNLRDNRNYGTEPSGGFISNQQLFANAHAVIGLTNELQGKVNAGTLDVNAANLEFQTRLPGVIAGVQGSGRAAYDNLLPGVRNYAAFMDVGVGVSKVTQGLATAGVDIFLAGVSNQIKPNADGSYTFPTQSPRVLYNRGYFQEIQSAPLGTPGKIAEVGSIAGLLVPGFVEGASTYATERAAGASRFEALNVVGGEALASFSPIQFNRVNVLGVRTTENVPLTFDNPEFPLRSARVGSFAKGDTQANLITSTGESRTVSMTTIDYVSVKPTLTELRVETKSLSYFTAQEVRLRPDNILSIMPTANENEYLGVMRGTRDIYTLSSQVVPAGNYDLTTQSTFTRTIESFRGDTQLRVLGTDENNLITFGVGKSEFSFKPIERYNFVFNDNGIETATFTGRPWGGGIPGRPSISRTFDFGSENARIDLDSGSVTYGNARSVGYSRGRKVVLGFKTEFYNPKADMFTISDESGRGFTSFQGGRGSGSSGRAGNIESPGNGGQVQISEQEIQNIVRSTGTGALSPSGRSVSISEVEGATTGTGSLSAFELRGLVASLAALKLNSAFSGGTQNNGLTQMRYNFAEQVLSQQYSLQFTGQTTQQFTSNLNGFSSNFNTGGSTAPGFTTPGFTPTFTLPVLSLPSIGGSSGGGRGGSLKKNARYKYTPDFRSLVTRRYGKPSGFSRPIPKGGFSWAFETGSMGGFF